MAVIRTAVTLEITLKEVCKALVVAGYVLPRGDLSDPKPSKVRLSLMSAVGGRVIVALEDVLRFQVSQCEDHGVATKGW